MQAAKVISRTREPGPLRILFLGNLIRRKGLHTLLEAIGPGQNGILPYKLDVVGSLEAEPDYAQKMRKRAEIFHLRSQVVFHGSLDQESLRAKLRSAHVLVVPSTYEGFGIVYLEGMAFGLPAIGTTAGGASEIIQDGENGYLIQPGDAKALAERLTRLANDRELLARMSVKALERYRQQPTWDTTAGQVREFLYGLLLPPLPARKTKRGRPRAQ
jgi:glycosyltransferase involved in cell wall biosynthesis